MTYLINYYKNRCETLQEQVNNLQNLLNEDDENVLDPKSKEGQAAARKAAQTQEFEKNPLITMTSPGFVMQAMYGDKLPKILKDIEERKKADPLKLQDKLNKTYKVPNYSKENLDKLIPIKVGKTNDPNAIAETDRETVTYNIDDTSKRLSTLVSDLKKRIFPSSYPATSEWDMIKVGNTAVHELVGHVPQDASTRDEEYSLNPYRNYRSMPETTPEERGKKYEAYVKSPSELSAHMTPLKFDYYQRTGKYLGANSTDEEIKTMSSFYKDYNKNNAEAGKSRQENINISLINPILDTLETEEGKELFRITAQKNKTKDSSNRMA